MDTTGTTAKPLKGTVRRIAECAECEAMLINNGHGWVHADSGELECFPSWRKA